MNVLVYDNEEQIGIAAGDYMCGQVLQKPNSVLGPCNRLHPAEAIRPNGRAL